MKGWMDGWMDGWLDGWSEEGRVQEENTDLFNRSTECGWV